jgi:hypothetical protein
MRRREHPDFAEEVSRLQYVIDFFQAHLSTDKHIDAIGIIVSLKNDIPSLPSRCLHEWAVAIRVKSRPSLLFALVPGI